jgi:hypothetical protein
MAFGATLAVNKRSLLGRLSASILAAGKPLPLEKKFKYFCRGLPRQKKNKVVHVEVNHPS